MKPNEHQTIRQIKEVGLILSHTRKLLRKKCELVGQIWKVINDDTPRAKGRIKSLIASEQKKTRELWKQFDRRLTHAP